MQAYLALLRLDLEQMGRSWLVRGWAVLLVAPAIFLVVVVASEQEKASETLALYMAAVLAPLSWLVVSILSATAVSGEANVIADSILSKSVTRSAYMWAKISARLAVFLAIYFVVTIPLSYLMARYATETPTESYQDTTLAGVAAGLLMVASLFVFLGTFGIALSTVFRNVQFAVVGTLMVAIVSGVGLQFLGLDWMSTTAVIDGLPETFRGTTQFQDEVRVMIVFCALALSAMMTGVWYFRRKDL